MINNQEIGLANSSWELIEIKELGKCITGTTPKTSEEKYYQPEEYDFIAPADLGDNKYITNSTKKISKKGLLVSRVLPKNTVMCVCIGSSIGKVGMTFNEASCSNQQINSIICNNYYLADFIYYLLLYYKEYWKSFSTFGPVPILSKGKFEQIPIPVLNNKIEQLHISYILSIIQKVIEQQGKLIKTTTELKKALMNRLFSEGTKGEKQKETEIGLVPESWEVKPLIEAVEFIDYGVSQAIPKNPPANGVKIVSTADINRAGDLLYEKIRTIEVPARTAEKLKLHDGDLLFNWRNSAELIGKSTIYHTQTEPHIFASFILRINCGEKKSHNYFLKYLMNHYREEGVFIKLARRAVNQANYNRNEISVLSIPLPPYNEQVEIAKTILMTENKINHHKTKKEALSDLFKTMLHELMTGQRRVNEIEFEKNVHLYKTEEQKLNIAAEP